MQIEYDTRLAATVRELNAAFSEELRYKCRGSAPTAIGTISAANQSFSATCDHTLKI
jgi:hypothetical protein